MSLKYFFVTYIYSTAKKENVKRKKKKGEERKKGKERRDRDREIERMKEKIK